MDRIYILAATIAVAGFACGGLYTTSSMGNGSAAIVNRFTGSAWSCSFMSCSPIRYRQD